MNKGILRRFMASAGLAAIAVLVGVFIYGCQSQSGKEGLSEMNNESFYAGGKFQADKAKSAYYELMNKFNYPIPPVLKTDQFWVCDFLEGKFTNIGMGGIFWINEEGAYGQTGTKKYSGAFSGKKFGYLGHDIYCLGGQALPEHRHVGGEKEFGPKMEAWHVRYGEAYFFSEMAAPGGDEMLIEKLPEAERPYGYGQPWFKCKYVAKRKAGEIYKLSDPEAWHFLRAGKDGAIISEYATFHNHVEFSKPGMKFACTGDK
jgi:hypothetical protein